MWLGLDTVPVEDLTLGFACSHFSKDPTRIIEEERRRAADVAAAASGVATGAAVDAENSTVPCITPDGNADTMLFFPSALLLESLVCVYSSLIALALHTVHTSFGTFTLSSTLCEHSLCTNCVCVP